MDISSNTTEMDTSELDAYDATEAPSVYRSPVVGVINNTLQDGNNTTESIYDAYFERQILAGTTFFASAVGILGNTAVIIAILVVKKLRTTTNVFVMNLAVADVLTCTVSPLQAVTILNDERVLPIWLCQGVAIALLTCIGCSINTLACIAVNRLVGIISTTRSLYLKLYTPWKIFLMIALSWCVPIAMAVIPLFSDYGDLGYNRIFHSCTWQSNRSYALMYSSLLAITFFPVQFILLIACYSMIFLYVRKTTRSTLRQGSSEDTDHNRVIQRQLWKRQVAVTKNLFIVVCVFVLCISPYFFVLGLRLTSALKLISYASTILMANSSVNPIIYGTKHPDFRAAFAKVLCYRRKTRMPPKQRLRPAADPTGPGQNPDVNFTPMHRFKSYHDEPHDP